MLTEGHLLEYNPFTERFVAKQREVETIEDEKRECSRQFVWYSNFNLDAEAETLASSKRQAERIAFQIERFKKERIREAALEGSLSQAAKIGLDPRRWFSAERIQHAKQRDEARQRLSQLDKSIADLGAEAKKALYACQQQQAQLDDYRTLDPLGLKAKHNALELRLTQLRSELASLKSDKERVDAVLSAPLLERRDLCNSLARLEKEVRLAESFDQRLSAARNGYERAMVHEECSKVFDGEGGPGRVKQKKHREIQTLRRNLDKVEARLKQIAQLTSRPISTLVIDGNNLCYEAGEFIGLEPLHALTYALADNHKVIVVFDSGIRGLLRMNDKQIAYGFPREVKVHVVASKQNADQTVLEMASPSDAYVISNDRFRDFTDKAAVIGQRLIRHEILAGKILIHELNLAIAFDRVRKTGDQHTP